MPSGSRDKGKISTPSWLDAPATSGAGKGASPKRPSGPDVWALVQRFMAMRQVRLGIAAAVAVVIAAGSYSWFFGDGASCRRPAARKQAVTLLLDARDPVTGDPLGDRFDRSAFRCAELPDADGVAGVLVETLDGSDPLTWYFDRAGKPHNVNQLASSWTPDFPAAPRLTTEQLATVRE